MKQYIIIKYQCYVPKQEAIINHEKYRINKFLKSNISGKQ